MNTKEIAIDEEVVNYIESLDYELSSRKDIIVFMLENDMKNDTESFRQYHEEYVGFFAKYNMAKNELSKKYIPSDWENHNINWSLDYGTKIITIKKLCDC